MPEHLGSAAQLRATSLHGESHYQRAAVSRAPQRARHQRTSNIVSANTPGTAQVHRGVPTSLGCSARGCGARALRHRCKGARESCNVQHAHVSPCPRRDIECMQTHPPHAPTVTARRGEPAAAPKRARTSKSPTALKRSISGLDFACNRRPRSEMRAFLASVGPSGHGFGVGSPRMRAPHLISFLSLPTQHRKKRTFYAGSRACLE